MKLTITFLTLIAALLLPSFAYAGAEMMSAERGPHCNLAATTVTIAAMDNKADPMEELVIELVNSTADPVLASYYRDLYLAPIQHQTVQFTRTADPYVDALSLAMYGSIQPDSQLTC